VLLYRLTKSEPAETNQLEKLGDHLYSDNGIFLKAYKDIPMADLEVTFPKSKLQLRPLDRVVISITLLLGIITLIYNLHADVSPIFALISIGSFLGVAAKVYSDYSSAMNQYESLLLNLVNKKNTNNNIATITYLMDELKAQEWKEAVLGYFFLMRDGPQTKQSLDTISEKFLFDLQSFAVDKQKIDFEVEDSLEKLMDMELITVTPSREKSGIVYSAIPLKDASEVLHKIWNGAFIKFTQPKKHTGKKKSYFKKRKWW